MDYIPVHDFNLPLEKMDWIQNALRTGIVEKTLPHELKYIS